MIRLLLLFAVVPITLGWAQEATPIKIAFVPDIHFHDIYGDFSDAGFSGVKVEGESNQVSIRTMEAQIHSTRLFNENYFALISTLDDIAAKGIKLVALPGDFTDDGQPVHLQGLALILHRYARQYDMRFFAIPGNHDPVRPFTSPGGEPDFLGPQGESIAIYSEDHARCKGSKASGETGKGTFCTPLMAHAGYEEIVHTMGPFGLMPDTRDLLWETPFLSDIEDSELLNNRTYLQCADNAPKHCLPVPDTSYLVEPVEGLWLLAIDANVYIPRFKEGEFVFSGSGNSGYNEVLSEKPFLVRWIRDVVRRAKEKGKTLIAFSHFPMGEFYDGQTESIRSLFGSDAFQLQREPSPATRSILADTGLRLHIGGHMHMNDTSIIHGRDNTLVNIQAPSIAAYRPAYKLLSLTGSSAKVETVMLGSVYDFDLLFGAYQKEHAYLTQHAPQRVWDDQILSATSYSDYTKAHLQALAKWRFIPAEWPEYFRQELLALSLWEVIVLGQQVSLQKCTAVSTAKACISQAASSETENANPLQQQMKRVTVQQFITDFYLIRNAGSLAFEDVSRQSQRIYHEVYDALREDTVNTDGCAEDSEGDRLCEFTGGIARALSLYIKLSQGAPDKCLIINMDHTNGSQMPVSC